MEKKEVWHLLLLCVHEKPNWANVKNKENENDNNGVTTSNAECSIKNKGSERRTIWNENTEKPTEYGKFNADNYNVQKENAVATPCQNDRVFECG